MYIVMGATGNVGGAVAETLLGKGEHVAIITRRPEGAGIWREKGAVVLEADINDVDSLRTAFREGRRAFLLNPSASPEGDADAEERRTIANILAALEGSSLEKVVAASTYGARPGEPAGDLTTLWALEEGLRGQAIPAAINRGAYYMTNWLGSLTWSSKPSDCQACFRPILSCPWSRLWTWGKLRRSVCFRRQPIPRSGTSKVLSDIHQGRLPTRSPQFSIETWRWMWHLGRPGRTHIARWVFRTRQRNPMRECRR